jgi:hypothetical protein
MVKKNVELKWGPKEKESFYKIKESIIQTPAFMSPYYERCFILYTFSSYNSYASIITQKNEEGDEL